MWWNTETIWYLGCTDISFPLKSKHLVSVKPPTHPNPNVVRICKSVRNIGRSLRVITSLRWLSVIGCCSILTSHVLMVMSRELMQISHVLTLISHVFVCLHMLMRFYYKLEWRNYPSGLLPHVPTDLRCKVVRVQGVELWAVPSL